MAVQLDGGDGLFTRLGRIIGSLNSVNTYRGTTFPSRVASHVADYADNTNSERLSSTVDGIYSQLTSWQGAFGSPLSYLRSLAQQTVIDQVALDVTLADKGFLTALNELIRQMVSSSDTIEKPTTSVSVATGSSNTGDARAAASLKNPDGVVSDYLYAEAISLACKTDAQLVSGAGREVFTAKGVLAANDMLAADWPKGSGASVDITAQHPDVAGTTLLSNGGFDTVPSANTFTGWTVDVGTAGTSILAGGSSDAYGGTGDVLELVGDGSELTSVYQTLTGLRPSTTYAVGCRVKVSAVPSGGVLALSLVNGSGTVINDAASVANTVSQDLTASTTSYVILSGFFRTPSIVPSTVRLRIKLTTALENAKSVFVDHLTLNPATRLYAGGPFLAVFSGATKSLIGDSFTATVANNYGGALVQGLWRLFNLPAMGVQIPSIASTNTISDSLVA